MKIFFASVALIGFATSQSFLEPTTLSWEPLPASVIPFNSTLSCGGCVRGGYIYCAEKGSKVGRGMNDMCCADEKCALQAVENNLDCGHANAGFNFTKNYYPDPYVLLQRFCSRRQDSLTCCGNNGNNECKLKTQYKKDQNLTLDVSKLTWGGSCTYKIEAKCGLPSISVNSSDVDVVVAFKKNKNGTAPPEPDTNETFDESANPKFTNGKITYTLPKEDKEADKNTTDESDCTMTKLYVTLTNLKNPA